MNHLVLLLMSVVLIHGYFVSNKNEQNFPLYVCYECIGSECSRPYVKTCQGALKCFTRTSLIDMEIIAEKGCFKVQLIMFAYCLDKVKMAQDETSEVIKCCNGNLCNDDEFIIPSIPVRRSPSILNRTGPSVSDHSVSSIPDRTSSSFPDHTIPSIPDPTIPTSGISFWLYLIRNLIVPGCIFVIISSLILGIACYLAVRKKEQPKENQIHFLKFIPEPYINDAFDYDGISNCTPGMIIYDQNCIAKDLIPIHSIEEGLSGGFYLGKMNGESVMIKIFSSENEALWRNEVKMYTEFSLCHENVLEFKGSVITSHFDVPEMWLATAFCEEGSLFDYLRGNLTHKQMIELARSACSGLLHLHSEIFTASGKGKPEIAHRNLKSSNFLVSSQGTCLIADFGLAIAKGDETSSSNTPYQDRIGSKRYLAPEVLDGSIDNNCFESFKRADIYAFGLVLWEICSRCISGGKRPDLYKLAFEDDVPNKPSLDDMKKVVCIEMKRPEIPEEWSSDEPLDAMTELINNCWHKNPESRFPVSRVMKILNKIYADIHEPDQSNS